MRLTVDARSAGMLFVLASAVATLVVPAVASAATARGLNSVPTTCPPVKLIRTTLKLKLTAVTSQSSVPTYPYGSPALPKKRPPSRVETCTYSTSGKFTSTSSIVPVTISFAGSMTKKDFAMARTSASEGAKPVTVKGLGDVAFLVKPPKYDPRAGSSLFVLTGSIDVVISAPPAATAASLERLARTLSIEH